MKKILKSLMVLFLAFPAFANANLLLGGVSGGGGNVINALTPTDPLSAQSVADLIPVAHQMLLDYLLQERQALHCDPNVTSSDRDLFAPLFVNHFQFINEVTNVAVNVLVDKPCSTFDNLPVDGSINSAPNTICISALDLSQKLNADQVRAQAAALMLHEYSEVFGLDEDQAVALQSRVLQDLLPQDQGNY